MRKLNTVANWFLRLFLLFISFTGIMVFIFLFRPEYFIDDIELIIKNMLPNSLGEELNIGNINGNFVIGFIKAFSCSPLISSENHFGGALATTADFWATFFPPMTEPTGMMTGDKATAVSVALTDSELSRMRSGSSDCQVVQSENDRLFFTNSHFGSPG